MKLIAIATLLVLWPVYSMAQDTEPPASPEPRVATILVGAGNHMGLGLQVDYYFHNERFSFFVAGGYSGSDPLSISFGAGARAFAGGKKHRALLQLSVSTLGWEGVIIDEDNVLWSRLYGPGLQIGYQYTGSGGFTFIVTGGLGYVLGAEDPRIDSTVGMMGLGAGYTWRR